MQSEELKQAVLAFLEEGAQAYIPQLSINCVIFGFVDQCLVVLATQPILTDTWFIPGDFVYQTESVDEAAYRSLSNKLGIDEIFLRQFKTFGETDRSFAVEMSKYFKETEIESSKYEWITKRFVTIGYYACVDLQKVHATQDLLSQEVRWMGIDDIDQLGFDHADIVREARAVLSKDLTDLPVIAKLLPETFTIPELQKLHEAILGRQIDRGNFRQKILKSKILKKIGERHTATTRRPPGLYRFDWKRYESVLEEEVKIGF